MVRIRLARGGRKKRPFYKIVATDIRKPRNSGYLEKLGSYNPLSKEFTVDVESLKKRVKEGASLSDTVKKLFVKQNVTY